MPPYAPACSRPSAGPDALPRTGRPPCRVPRPVAWRVAFCRAVIQVRPYDRVASCGFPPRGRRARATVAEAAIGTRLSRVRAAGSGRDTSAARNSAAAPSNGMPVRSPRSCRKKSSASIEPRAVERAVVTAETAIRRPGPRPMAERPGRGRVPGSVRATASAKYTVAASGAAHQARRRTLAAEASGCVIAYPSVHSSRKPVPPDAAATRSRRSWTRGRAPRARRRASTRPGLPARRPGAGGPCSRAVRRGVTPCGRRAPWRPRRVWRGRP